MPKVFTSKSFKISLPIIIIVLGYFVYQYQVSHPVVIKPTASNPHLPVVELIKVELKDPKMTVRSYGVVEPQKKVTLKTKVGGHVTWTSDQLINGGVVKEGERILQIDKSDYMNDVALARAAVERNKLENEHARKRYARINALSSRNSISEDVVDDALYALSISSAKLQEARIRLKQSEAQYNHTTIVAPFGGRISGSPPHEGQYLSPADSIATIFSDTLYKVEVPLTLTQLQYLGIRDFTELGIHNEQIIDAVVNGEVGSNVYRWRGQLTGVSGEVNRKTNSVNIILKLNPFSEQDNVPILPGMTVNAELTGIALRNIVELPRQALQNNSKVLVLREGSRLHSREINVLRSDEDLVYINSGLKEGEWVCITPLQSMIDGMRVNTIYLAKKVVSSLLPTRNF